MTVRVVQCLAPHATGGIESMVRSLCTGLLERQHTVRVLAMVVPDSPDMVWVAAMRDRGIAVEVLRPTRSLVRDCTSLRAALRRYPVDLIHAHGYRSDILTAVMSRRARPRRVATIHGFSPTDWKSRWYSRLDRLALRRFDHVIAVSNPIRDVLLSSGVSPGRVSVLHNGIDVPAAPAARHELRAALGLEPSDFVIGSVGRLSTEKGHADLLDALVIAGPLGARLLLVGTGPERRALEAHALATGLGDRVRFLGERYDIERLYPAFDLFALPSHTEGSPTALLEALAYGVPVVATAVGGVPDMLRDGIEGLLVPPHSPALLGAALARLAASREMRAEHAARGHERYEAQFRRDRWLDRVEATYRAVVETT